MAMFMAWMPLDASRHALDERMGTAWSWRGRDRGVRGAKQLGGGAGAGRGEGGGGRGRTLSRPRDEAEEAGREPRIEGVTDPVAKEIEGENRDSDGETGKEHEPPLGYEPRDRVREHIAPGGGGRGHAHAEEAEGRLDHDGHPQMGGGEDEVGSDALGQHVKSHDPEGGSSAFPPR